MSDNVAITAGTGTAIAADDISSVWYQRIKLTDGTADSTTPINVDIGAKANALRVAPASDITDATYIGDIKFGEALATVTTVGTVTAITSLDGAIAGSGSPTIDSYTQVAINLTTAANQVLVSSAANKQIWVYGYGLSCGDADGQTVSLQDEDDTAITGIMEFAQYGGISVPCSGNFAMPLFKLGTDKDLEIDITGGDCDGFLTYAIVSV